MTTDVDVFVMDPNIFQSLKYEDGSSSSSSYQIWLFRYEHARKVKRYKIVEACFLNKSKFMPSSCLARDPRVHAQLENKAGFFKHSKLEILGS